MSSAIRTLRRSWVARNSSSAMMRLTSRWTSCAASSGVRPSTPGIRPRRTITCSTASGSITRYAAPPGSSRRWFKVSADASGSQGPLAITALLSRGTWAAASYISATMDSCTSARSGLHTPWSACSRKVARPARRASSSRASTALTWSSHSASVSGEGAPWSPRPSRYAASSWASRR